MSDDVHGCPALAVAGAIDLSLIHEILPGLYITI